MCKLSGRVLLAIGLLGAALNARADELSDLYAELSRTGKIPTIEQGQAALEKLETLEAKGGDAERKLNRCRIYAHLAVGDAAGATEALDELLRVMDSAPETLEAAYIVYTARGDAPKTDELLKKMKDASGDMAKKVSLRQRRLKKIGVPGPESAIETDKGEVSLGRRDANVLVIDLWSMRSKPTDAQVRAIRTLYEEYKSDLPIDFLGINTDGPARIDEAEKFAQEKKLEWAQHFEKKSTDAPITHKFLNAGQPPWQVIIDRAGVIRAVGDASEPAFQFALRAAVAEAKNEYPALNPVPLSGAKPSASDKPKTAAKPEPTKPTAKPDEKPAEPPKTKGELPSNDEAASKLRQARAFIRAGQKTQARKLLEEIVRDYPGTREAKDAEERLADLGG